MQSENLIKGQIIELKVQEELLRYGFDISIPSYNSSRYDLIADTGKELLKIQVKKSIGVTENSFKFDCCSSNVTSKQSSKHKYTKEEIDYFATVWQDKVYLIPVDETSYCKTIQLIKNSYGNYAEDYLCENVLQSYTRLSDDELYNFSHQGQYHCDRCGCEIKTNSKYCVSCKNLLSRTVERPSRDTLKTLIRTKSFLEIGKMYGVSDNAIRRWCDAEKLPRKKTDINSYSEEEWNNI